MGQKSNNRIFWAWEPFIEGSKRIRLFGFCWYLIRPVFGDSSECSKRSRWCLCDWVSLRVKTRKRILLVRLLRNFDIFGDSYRSCSDHLRAAKGRAKRQLTKGRDVARFTPNTVVTRAEREQQNRSSSIKKITASLHFSCSPTWT